MKIIPWSKPKISVFRKFIQKQMRKMPDVRRSEIKMGQGKKEKNKKRISTTPDISVVIPAFNASETISDLIESLHRQLFENFEVILVNDASQDDTGIVLQKIQKKPAHFQLINLTENVGPHEARKIGVLKSQGKWIAFTDADDILDDSFLERMFCAANETSSDLVVCSADKIDESGKNIGQKVRFSREKIFAGNVLDAFCSQKIGTGSLWNKLYRRSLIVPHITRSFKWRQDVGEDTLVNIGCFHDARRVSVLPDVLYHYRVHPKSIIQHISSAKAYVQMLRAFALALSIYVPTYPAILSNLVKLYSSQLQFGCYQIRQLEALEPYVAELTEALHVIGEIAPQSLAALPQVYDCVHKPAPHFRKALRDWKRSTNNVFSSLGRTIEKNIGLCIKRSTSVTNDSNSNNKPNNFKIIK
jgi:glycosyltransferase involved in cell wall biosynthesis